jgi:hypothetical protein
VRHEQRSTTDLLFGCSNTKLLKGCFFLLKIEDDTVVLEFFRHSSLIFTSKFPHVFLLIDTPIRLSVSPQIAK